MSVLTLSGSPISFTKPPNSKTIVKWSRTDMYGRAVKGSFRAIAHLDYTDQLAVKKYGSHIVVIQPPFNKGVAASAGTHDYDMCFDVYIPGVSWSEQQKFFRANGWGAYWRRPPKFGNHIHMFSLPLHEGTSVSDDYKVAGFKVGKFVDGGWSLYGHKPYGAQIDAYYAHRDALASNAKDTSWFPGNITKTIFDLSAYISRGKAAVAPTTVNIVGFNLPAPGVGSGADLGNDAARIKAGTDLIKASNVHIVGWNELGPRLGEGKASKFAAAVAKALGSGWKMIIPKGAKGAFNENYFSYRSPFLTLVTQYDDSVLEGTTGNRHLTRVVFKRSNGFVFAVGLLHAVSGSSATNEKDRQRQADDSLTSMLAVTAKHDDCPFIILGDFNTHNDLVALVKAGMKRSRKYADNTISATATYTNYTKDKPSTNPEWEVDQTYFSKHWYVLTYKVLRVLSGGKYVKPRPSDHDATFSSARA